jgi:maltose alpha-D-glucosyltransferase/alpha-amylase
MLRSFAYAATVSVDKASADRPQDREKLTASVVTWQNETEKAFLEGYRNATSGTPCDVNNENAQQLIHLFTLEKSLYETRYELGNRPDWTHIPLTHVVAMLTKS